MLGFCVIYVHPSFRPHNSTDFLELFVEFFYTGILNWVYLLAINLYKNYTTFVLCSLTVGAPIAPIGAAPLPVGAPPLTVWAQ